MSINSLGSGSTEAADRLFLCVWLHSFVNPESAQISVKGEQGRVYFYQAFLAPLTSDGASEKAFFIFNGNEAGA